MKKLQAAMMALMLSASVKEGVRSQSAAEDLLTGAGRLEMQGDLAAKMVSGIDAFLTRELAASTGRRAGFWQQDFASPPAYARSVQKNRERFHKIIGLVDPRTAPAALELVGAPGAPPAIARGNGFNVYAVRWTVFDGVEGEGLLLQPDVKSIGRIVALPDADQSPEEITGLAPETPLETQFARRLAEYGYQVLVPVLIDRKDTWSGNSRIRFTNQPHREFVYRAAFEMGRHIIGYEVQKTLAAVDWFIGDAAPQDPAVAVVGYGEGALLALCAAAADPRIDAALVSGYFQEREGIWEEPIYRNVWSLLREFGDAELAGLIAPRPLVIEAARGPELGGPPPPREDRRGAAPGRLVTPPLESVRREFNRAQATFGRLGVSDNIRLIVSGSGAGSPLSETTLRAFMQSSGLQVRARPPAQALKNLRPVSDPLARLRRQFDQLNNYTQHLVRESEVARERFWSRADASSLERFVETSRPYRDYLWDEVIGRLPSPADQPNARTRLAYDEPAWRGYEVVLDLYPDVFVYGALLLPKDLKPGERRPVVVCQHGLEGRPDDTIRRDGRAFSVYKAFSARLAERGFVVFAPQNPYIGQDKFRVLQRKANPLGLSLFSFIVRQHERLLDWLAGQPFVDPSRIGFYGLSYGGKTAVRVPPLLAGRYALSICSADFNEWILKNTSLSYTASYMFTGEYEMPEFDLGNTFNYAELTRLMVPRPFMVERGHRDGVAPDEWVAYEYAKVRRLYTTLGIGDRTAIEFFNGPHEINGVGTFEFLEKHLK